MEKYYCVFCGEPILPEERNDKLMVSLSYAALDGATDSLKFNTKVYVTKGELETLVERRDAKGGHYLDLKEYIAIAYNKRNLKYRKNHTLNVENTLKELEAIILKRIEKQNRKDITVQAQEQGIELNEQNQTQQIFQHPEEKETEIQIEQSRTLKEVLTSAFDETVADQLIKNFGSDGKCYLDWRIDERYGYGFRLKEKIDAVEHTTQYWACAECGEQILDSAFQYRHILIGVLGRRSAGKTCMIGAICHKFGGYLDLPKAYKKDFEEELADFINGYSMGKTRTENADNTFHPSIVCNSVLWTIVDIPGERFYDEGDIDFDALVQVPVFKMSLKCHTYILAVEKDTVQDQRLVEETTRAFSLFIDFANTRNANSIVGAPMILAITKVDSVEGEICGDMRGLDHYPRKYRDELFIIRNLGLGKLVDDLSKKNYLFPVTCAPYGFSPLKPDDPEHNRYPATEHKEQWKAKWKEDYFMEHPEAQILRDDELPMPHPVFRRADPRNIDMIIDWLKKLYGVDSYILRNDEIWEPKDISRESRNTLHDSADMIRRITYMFVNPTEYDLKFDHIQGENYFIKRILTAHYRRKFFRNMEKR